MQSCFKIKRSLVVPLVLDTCLFVLLLLTAIFRNGSALEIWVLAVGLIPLLLISVEVTRREIRIDETGITLNKMFRSKNILWGEMTHVGSLVLYKKAYLLLTTTKGFYIVSNAYADFTFLVKNLIDQVEKDRVEESLSVLVDVPVKRVSDIVLFWAAAVIIIGTIFIKLFG